MGMKKSGHKKSTSTIQVQRTLKGEQIPILEEVMISQSFAKSKMALGPAFDGEFPTSLSPYYTLLGFHCRSTQSHLIGRNTTRPHQIGCGQGPIKSTLCGLIVWLRPKKSFGNLFAYTMASWLARTSYPWINLCFMLLPSSGQWPPIAFILGLGWWVQQYKMYASWLAFVPTAWRWTAS